LPTYGLKVYVVVVTWAQVICLKYVCTHLHLGLAIIGKCMHIIPNIIFHLGGSPARAGKCMNDLWDAFLWDSVNCDCG